MSSHTSQKTNNASLKDVISEILEEHNVDNREVPLIADHLVFALKEIQPSKSSPKQYSNIPRGDGEYLDFGKYKGMKISSILRNEDGKGESYLRWVLKNVSLNQDTFDILTKNLV